MIDFFLFFKKFTLINLIYPFRNWYLLFSVSKMEKAVKNSLKQVNLVYKDAPGAGE